MSGNRSKKTMKNHPPAAAKAEKNGGKFIWREPVGDFSGGQYRRGRPPKAFDWDSVTPEERAEAMAVYLEKKKKEGK